MEQMTFVKNEMENTLIEGVKKVSDKVYRFVAIYDRVWVEVEKYEPIQIIDGLETYISLIKKDGMEYWEAFEGVTGAVVGYSFVGMDGKAVAKEKTIKKATEQLKMLQNDGVLVNVLTKIAAHITNGISPRYEGKLIDINNRSEELKKLNIGDSIALINLRGGLSYYTAKVESYKNVDYGDKLGIEYIFISNNNGYHFHKVLGIDKLNQSFYYEPEFVELHEKAVIENSEEEVVISNIDVPAPVNNERVWQEDLRKHLVFADKTDFYNIFEENMIQAADLLTDTEIPEDIIEYNKLLTLNGYLLTEARTIENKVSAFYYSLLLPSIKRIIRVKLSNKNDKLYYQFSITTNQEGSTAFGVRWSLGTGYIETLKEVLTEVSRITAENVMDIEGINAVETTKNETFVEKEKITAGFQTEEVSTEILAIIKENLATPSISLNRYNNWEDSVRKSALENADKELPEVLIRTDKFLLNNGFVRSANVTDTAEKYHVLYFMPMSENRSCLRVVCYGACVNNVQQDIFQIRIMKATFDGEGSIYSGGIETLEDIVNLCLVAIGDNITNSIQADKNVKTIESAEIENKVISDMITTGQIWDATPMDIEDDWLKRFEDVENLLVSSRNEIKNLKELLKDQKGEEKKITLQKVNNLKVKIVKAEAKINDEQQKIYINIEDIIVDRIKAKLGAIPIDDVSTLADEVMNALSDDISYREIYYNKTVEDILNELIVEYLEEKTKGVQSNKVYTLEEIAKTGINIDKTHVQVEDITTLSNEEFELKRNCIWAMKQRYEARERAKEIPNYSYTETFEPLYEILKKEEHKRTLEYIETLTEEQIKYFVAKWLSGDCALEAYNNGGKAKIQDLIKNKCVSFSGGTLMGDYRFFIGNVQCQNKKITANIKNKITAENTDYITVIMSINEAAEYLMKYYNETLKDTETKPIIETVNIKVKVEIKEIDQVSFIELTAQEMGKIFAKVKNKKQKSNLIEGQMMLAI